MTDTDDIDDTEISIDQAIQLASGVVTEVRDLVRDHLADLHAVTVTTDHATVPISKANADPQHAAHMHRLQFACDTFINAVNGRY